MKICLNDETFSLTLQWNGLIGHYCDRILIYLFIRNALQDVIPGDTKICPKQRQNMNKQLNFYKTWQESIFI